MIKFKGRVSEIVWVHEKPSSFTKAPGEIVAVEIKIETKNAPAPYSLMETFLEGDCQITLELIETELKPCPFCGLM